MRDSLAMKTAMIGLLTLLLLIPLGMIREQIAERQKYQDTVRRQVAQSWSGPQTLLSPILVQPYVIEVLRETTPGAKQKFITTTEQRIRMLAPASLNLKAVLETQRRYKGIYSVPVYDAVLEFHGHVNMQALLAMRLDLSQQPGIQSLGEPFLALALTDQRGISATPGFAFNGRTLPTLPGSGLPGWPEGIRAEVPVPENLSLPLSLVQSDHFAATLRLRGTETLLLVPAAGNAAVSLTSRWPHPEFIGAFLPAARRIDAAGFTAAWSVNEFNSAVGEHIESCAAGSCGPLRSAGLGVRLFEAVNIYLLAERASKYGILFIGLSFAVFFATEITRRMRIHPIQYAFAGLALALFFLLLIALSEHVPFGAAYCIAAASCIALLGLYLRHVLRGRRGAAGFSAALSAIYALIYVTIQAEDYAFLMGSVLTFATLAAVMTATRTVDWYQKCGDSIRISTEPPMEQSLP